MSAEAAYLTAFYKPPHAFTLYCIAVVFVGVKLFDAISHVQCFLETLGYLLARSPSPFKPESLHFRGWLLQFHSFSTYIQRNSVSNPHMSPS